jgi:hypothetical protein
VNHERIHRHYASDDDQSDSDISELDLLSLRLNGLRIAGDVNQQASCGENHPEAYANSVIAHDLRVGSSQHLTRTRSATAFSAAELE